MRVSRIRPVQHELDRFRAEPASLRNAAAVLIAVTVLAVLHGSLVMWVFDRRDFPDFGTALWFTLQTVTTVGYGDVTPASDVGRVVAGVVMIVAIAFLAMVTALITSTFIDAAQRRRAAQTISATQDASDRVDDRFEQVVKRLEAIEAALARLEAAYPIPTPPTVGTPSPPDTEPAG
jgi:voltage-gated potassium channel Kch